MDHAAGFALIELTGFWVPYMLLSPTNGGSISQMLPDPVEDSKTFVQDR